MHVGQKHENGDGIPTLEFGVELEVFFEKAIEIHKSPKTNPGAEKHHHVVIESQPLGKGIIHPLDKKSSRLEGVKPIGIPLMAVEIIDRIGSVKLGVGPIDQAKKHVIPVHLIEQTSFQPFMLSLQGIEDRL